MTASGAAQQCFRADNNANIQLVTANDIGGGSWTGAISCPGGAGHGTVVQFAQADGASSIDFQFPMTVNNASTPSSSSLGGAYRASAVGLDAIITASNFTSQCTAYDVAAVVSGFTRTFTSIGGNITGTGGVCDFY
jgi:hypothetical protein